MADVKQFFWSKKETPAELQTMLSTLGETYPVAEGQGQRQLHFLRSGCPGELKVTASSGGAVMIEYGSLNCAARGLGLALSGCEGTDKIVFKTLGIMLDCSRNAVMTVTHFKEWLRQLALLGYNMAMLYTEDTYQLPGEPYFGYMRGSYTLAELKEIDAYARGLGIEMIGCIQVLGHMEQMLQWSAYSEIKDTRNVMLVDEPKTYALIDKMIAFWSEALCSRRIHIGMDETHDLGRGSFMDKFGYERGFDIFNRQLSRVNELCEKHQLKPMIWSDMYFRLGNPTQNYYDMATVIPDDVKKQIPANADLVYWDYYHRDKDFYVEWIRRHRDLGHEPLMGSGVWTWSKLWCDHEITRATVGPCLEACRETRLEEVFFTLWGDDGAYCEFDSALCELAWAAELSFGHDGADERMEKIFRGVCGGDYRAHRLATGLTYTDPADNFKINTAPLLWDDPLMMKYLAEIRKIYPDAVNMLAEYYGRLAVELKPFDGAVRGGEIRLALLAAQLIRNKYALLGKLEQAYRSRDHKALAVLAAKDIPAVIADCRRFSATFRTQWLRRNKPFGLDVIQVRMGGQIARWEETAQRLTELAEGTIDCIPELEANTDISADTVVNNGGWGRWALSSVSIW